MNPLDQLDRTQTGKRSAFDLYIAQQASAADANSDSSNCVSGELACEEQERESTERNDSLQSIIRPSNASSHDDDELMGSVEQVELEHNVWDFCDPVSIMGSILFNNDDLDLP